MQNKSLKSEIERLARLLKKAAKGDYSERADMSRCSPDLKSLAESLNQLLAHMDQVQSRFKLTEHSLREREERYRSLFEDSTLGIYRTTPKGEILLVNRAALRMLGYDSFTNLAKRNLEKTGFEPSYPRSEFKKRLKEEGVIIGLESAWLRKDGSTIYVRESARAVRDHAGKLLYYDGTFEDITERKKAEQRVENDLKEKELLLKEIHHRVKNNLQIICSLLNLQSHKVRDEEAKTAFQYCKNRIYSMALVHEHLYRSQDFSNIQMKSYVEQLIHEMERAYHVASRIRIHHRVEAMTLGIDKAIPCGLILNELITNAMKHAFPDALEGWIRIELKKQGSGHAIHVQDNGVGLPDNFDLGSTRSLGLHMVEVLIKQLNGKLDLTRSPGTDFLIRF